MREWHAAYAQLRRAAPAGSPIAVLHIGAERTGLALGDGLEPGSILALDLGWRGAAQGPFRFSTPAGLEASILEVEEALMHSMPAVAAGTTLFTQDRTIREIARISHVPDAHAMELGLDALERSFQRLAARAHGSPPSLVGLPDDPEFCATLLILREFLHHYSFASITVRA